MRIAESLRHSVEDFRFDWEGRNHAVGVSIGLATFANGALSVAEAIRMADSACYAAKAKGRNQIHIYTPADDPTGSATLDQGHR